MVAGKFTTVQYIAQAGLTVRIPISLIRKVTPTGYRTDGYLPASTYWLQIPGKCIDSKPVRLVSSSFPVDSQNLVLCAAERSYLKSFGPSRDTHGGHQAYCHLVGRRPDRDVPRSASRSRAGRRVGTPNGN